MDSLKVWWVKYLLWWLCTSLTDSSVTGWGRTSECVLSGGESLVSNQLPKLFRFFHSVQIWNLQLGVLNTMYVSLLTTKENTIQPYSAFWKVSRKCNEQISSVCWNGHPRIRVKCLLGKNLISSLHWTGCNVSDNLKLDLENWESIPNVERYRRLRKLYLKLHTLSKWNLSFPKDRSMIKRQGFVGYVNGIQGLRTKSFREGRKGTTNVNTQTFPTLPKELFWEYKRPPSLV